MEDILANIFSVVICAKIEVLFLASKSMKLLLFFFYAFPFSWFHFICWI